MISTPQFPQLSGTEQLPRILKSRIAALAWEKAEGNTALFQRFCFQHVRGEIDLFADHPPETDVSERVRMDRLEREFALAAQQPPPAAEAAPVAPAAPAGRAVPRDVPAADRRE
jgi:hypothetical protein